MEALVGVRKFSRVDTGTGVSFRRGVGEASFYAALLKIPLPSLATRAGHKFWGLNFQTPPWSLAQNMNVYQVWGP